MKGAKRTELPPGALPPYQPLPDIYSYELKKRSTPGGLGQAAVAGDRTAIARFAALAAVAVEDGSPPEYAPIRERLASILGAIELEVPPNEAFGWTGNDRGRPGTRSNFEELEKQYLIGLEVTGLLSSNPDLSETKAFGIVDRVYEKRELPEGFSGAA